LPFATDAVGSAGFSGVRYRDKRDPTGPVRSALYNTSSTVAVAFFYVVLCWLDDSEVSTALTGPSQWSCSWAKLMAVSTRQRFF